MEKLRSELIKIFNDEFSVLCRDYAINKDIATINFNKSMDTIISLNANIVTLQVSSEGYILYTIIKGDYTIFFQHYVDTKPLMEPYDDEHDEVIMSTFRDKKAVQPLQYGKLNEVSSKLKQYIK